jgi:hypothetical protein
LAQPARPVRLQSGPQSSTLACTSPRVYEALRKIAFEEGLKIHDVMLEGIDLALRRQLLRAKR